MKKYKVKKNKDKRENEIMNFIKDNLIDMSSKERDNLFSELIANLDIALCDMRKVKVPVISFDDLLKQDKADEEQSLLKDVTRLEVIDKEGRSYTNHNIIGVIAALQDDNRTLKLFVGEDEKETI